MGRVGRPSVHGFPNLLPVQSNYRVPRAGDLAVACWCEADFVAVPRQEVLDGLTRSCGSAACDAIDRSARGG